MHVEQCALLGFRQAQTRIAPRERMGQAEERTEGQRIGWQDLWIERLAQPDLGRRRMSAN